MLTEKRIKQARHLERKVRERERESQLLSNYRQFIFEIPNVIKYNLMKEKKTRNNPIQCFLLRIEIFVYKSVIKILSKSIIYK